MILSVKTFAQCDGYIASGGKTVESMLRGIVLLLLLGFVSSQVTTAPAATPQPSTGSPLVLSFVVDGVVYAVRCSFSAANVSNCSFVAEHGLIVSASSLTGNTEIPVYITGMLAGTLVVTIILLGLIVAGYIMWKRSPQAAGYMPQGQGGMGPPGYQPQAYMEPGPPQGYDPYRVGQASQMATSLPVIGVNLVRPSLPREAAMA